VIFRNLLWVCGYVWFSTISLRLIEIEFILKFWYFWNISLSLWNRKKRKLRWYSETFCEHRDVFGLVELLWDWLRLNLYQKIDIFEISFYLFEIERKESWGDVQEPFVSMGTYVAWWSCVEIDWDWIYTEISP
jgi:hypothetical protein